MYERSGRVCEACGMQRATEWQHRLPRSVGGLWVPSNGLHLDHTCHQWVTEHPKQANVLGQHLYSWQQPAETPVLLFGRGWVLLQDDGTVISRSAA